MKKLLNLSFLTASIFLAGCNGSDSNNSNSTNTDNRSNSNNEKYIGTWLAPAYGEALVIDKDRVSTYQYTSDYCLLSEVENSSNEDLEEDLWKLSEDQLSMRQELNLLGISQRQSIFYKASALPIACLNNLVPLKGESAYQANPERDFDLFWKTFAEYYPAFEQRNVNWNTQREALSITLDNNTSDEQLFYAIADTIATLKDSHVTLYSPNGAEANFTRGTVLSDRLTEEYIAANGSVENDQQYANYVAYVEQQIDLLNEIRLSYAPDSQQIQQAANEQLTWYITDDNIGYLNIENMIFFATDDLDDVDFIDELTALKAGMEQAMSDLTNTQGLIIDIRQNSGGFDGASQLITQYFLDTERHLYSKQARLGDTRTELEHYTLAPATNTYQKPVILLTSTASVSAAEVFTLMMRSLPNVTLVGEATQGALADILSKDLPNGFSIDLVNEYYLSPEGEWFEGLGIPVDQTIEFSTQSQRLAGTDEGINTAIELLNNP